MRHIEQLRTSIQEIAPEHFDEVAAWLDNAPESLLQYEAFAAIVAVVHDERERRAADIPESTNR